MTYLWAFSLPKSLHKFSSFNCTQRTPAGLPFGIPGINDVILGAMQHAPQPNRHSIIKLTQKIKDAQGITLLSLGQNLLFLEQSGIKRPLPIMSVKQ